jgi:hypothetical protein
MPAATVPGTPPSRTGKPISAHCHCPIATVSRVLKHVADPHLVRAEPDWYTLAIDHPEISTAVLDRP